MADTERRFVVIGTDGRAATASRGDPPDEETLDNAAEGLDAIGMGGWLAVIEPDPSDANGRTLRPLRCLTATIVEWNEIEQAYRARQSAALRP